MSEFQPKNASLNSAEQFRSADPLQESFVRLQQAEQLRQLGRFDQAQLICESLLRERPHYAGALHTLGLVWADREKHQEALNFLVRAAMLNPSNWMTLTALAGVYLRLGAIEMAMQTIAQAKSTEPHEANVLLMLGDVLREDRQYELACDAYREAVAADRDLVPAAIGLGWCYADIGEYRQAAVIFEDLIKRGVRSIEPLRALASFAAPAVHIDLLAQLDSVLRDPSEDKTDFEISIAFIRASALDHVGRCEEAWACAEAANRRVFPAMQPALAKLDERRRASLAALRGYRQKFRFERTGGQPISLFILGPSRSGKTTMEKLVGSLSGVKRGYENPIIENSVRRTFQASALPPDESLKHLPMAAYPLCRTIYRDELLRRTGSAQVVTNTQSSCIFEAAQIAAIFENVRFIFMKRDIEDNLLRIYLRKYQVGNAYGYDLVAAREHITWYHQMIDFMVEKFPAIVRVINYEDMVSNPSAAVRTAAELCGLPAPTTTIAKIAGDVGCAAPYRDFMALELSRE
jgi:tetratricopeptide (TPR) repeat protein